MAISTSLTKPQAIAVFNILVENAGARADEHDQMSFVVEFTKERPTREYRFKGGLGFGGKLRFPRLTVDCYPEDETPARAAMVEKTNAALAAFAQAEGLV
jgi:hypothetical protein